MTEQERKNKTIAALTTVGVNAILLLILIFVAAWGNAGSGPGEYPGIEVNLGYDDQGSGDIEPKTPIGSEEAKDDENPPAKAVDQPQEQPAETPPAAEENNTKIVQPTTVTDPNSDVEIKEEKKEVKPTEKTVDKKIEKVEKPVEKKPIEQPKVDPKAVYSGKSSSNAPSNENGTGKQGTSGNQGDDVGKEGNKGVPGGTEGAAVYKGKPGGGDGGSLDLYGWDWDYIPKVDAPDNELPGRIVYLIEVDGNGDLIGYRKESSTVSAAAEKVCAEALSKLTFTKKTGAKVPEISKGKITFVIRAK